MTAYAEAVRPANLAYSPSDVPPLFFAPLSLYHLARPPPKRSTWPEPGERLDPDRYRRLKQILLLASEKKGPEREAILEEACGDDRRLREEVDHFLDTADVKTGRLHPAAWDLVLSKLLDGGELPDPDREADGPCAPGEVLGHYRILEKVGEGGMGEVWKALDTSLDREVAIKLLPRRLSHHPQLLARFRREAKVVASLNHPNIVVIHAVEHESAAPFMVMELVRGKSLRHVIPPEGLRVRELLDHAIPIADALATAHESGVTHRDVKPENVMISGDGRVKVLDFGIAATAPSKDRVAGRTRSEELVSTGHALIGTPAYMSPEQVRSEPVDPRSDVFSFGILLYEMALGERPFDAGSVSEITASILRDDPPPISSRRSDLPVRLGEIVSRCLGKEPRERPATARPVHEDLVELRRWVERAALQNLAWPGEEQVTPADRSATGSSGPRRAPSVGVLPFLDLSPDHDLGHICVGISEDIATRLARTADVGVTVASRMDREAVDPADMGRVLRVESVLDGSVRRHGEHLRVTARIIDAGDGSQLWSERFDRFDADVFALQDEVAEAVARHFDTRLSPRKREGHGSNPDAYAAYLRGRHFWGKRYEGGLKRALECFAEALSVDPRMAAAHAGRADCFAILGHYGLVPPQEAYAQAREGARRALELAPDLAEAHTTMGWISSFYDWSWPEAGRWFGQAIELDPRYATAREWNAIHLLARGHGDAALESVTKAHRLDPLSLMISTIHAWIHDVLGRQKEALDILNTVLEMDPRFSFAHIILTMLLATSDRAEEAATTMERGITPTQREGLALSCLGFAYGRAGRTTDAENVIREMEGMRGQRYVSPLHLAITHLGVDRHGEALDLMEEAVRERDSFLASSHPARMYDGVRDHPRFRALLREIRVAD